MNLEIIFKNLIISFFLLSILKLIKFEIRRVESNKDEFEYVNILEELNRRLLEENKYLKNPTEYQTTINKNTIKFE